MPPAKSQPSAKKNGSERRLSAQTPRKANGEPQRIVHSEHQRKLLEEAFQRNKFIAGEEKTFLANRLGLPEASIKNWFYTRRNKGKRQSLQDELAAIEPAANEEGNNQMEPEDQDVQMGHEQPAPAPAALEPAEAPAGEGALEPTLGDAQAVMDWLSSQIPPRAVYHPVAVPQPLPTPVPHVTVGEDSLVETSGRAMILRLRQLYEKDTKLFLRAQNDVNNAIFKYEDKDL